MGKSKVLPTSRINIKNKRAEHDYLVTLEENALMGGAGSAVLEALARHNTLKPLLPLGLPDIVTEHGDPAKLLADLGLDATGIHNSISHWLAGLESNV